MLTVKLEHLDARFVKGCTVSSEGLAECSAVWDCWLPPIKPQTAQGCNTCPGLTESNN